MKAAARYMGARGLRLMRAIFRDAARTGGVVLSYQREPLVGGFLQGGHMGLTEDEGWCRWCQSYGNVHDESKHKFPHPRRVTVTGDAMVTGLQPDTVDITPTWTALVLPMLDAYRGSTNVLVDDEHTFLRQEFLKMAMAADRYIATVDKPGVLATDMLTSEGLRP